MYEMKSNGSSIADQWEGQVCANAEKESRGSHSKNLEFSNELRGSGTQLGDDEQWYKISEALQLQFCDLATQIKVRWRRRDTPKSGSIATKRCRIGECCVVNVDNDEGRLYTMSKKAMIGI
ncbi:hypothetical protein GE21DRAFT_2970 [Neurospora crassa]|uniref:Uncharacterized protein n=1 Tax=Neurospora crassa (strain ATCC 24698 / 74-OR23-1A / CBS 708.71 / DSM 1257 / FGSC 987) TaxID=367110 RepID=Q7RUK0_NEUCR|nr:hypothetical protein NCU05382 [Neurospora crassa OR74A]EAA33959.2 hypothetical protein NCU05382 [Neurospora crassa OR74A]KHE85326.1 hypothetical protein GE21DRAFT_2970 [Neurospora crassa]|eukprot:XP_963195.2 hypothetical protein NCU05382 [Neurospora crassa OR74A]